MCPHSYPPRDVQFASGARSSHQGGNQGRSVVVGDRALSAPRNEGGGADDPEEEEEEELIGEERHTRWENEWKVHFDRLNQLRS